MGWFDMGWFDMGWFDMANRMEIHRLDFSIRLPGQWKQHVVQAAD
jgi:hypothetical protein